MHPNSAAPAKNHPATKATVSTTAARLCRVGIAASLLAWSGAGFAQSSSLLMQPIAETGQGYRYHLSQRNEQGLVELDPGVAMYNTLAVQAPPPREFMQHDLVTIIVRESIETDLENELKTEKSTSQAASIAEIPWLMEAARNKPLTLGLDATQDYEGKGEKTNSNSVTSRVTAEIAQVLPNGNLVLEARKLLQVDEEVHELLLSGICRPEDITSENTVLSNQLHRLTLRQITDGSLKQAAKKGWITQTFDNVFGF